MLEDSRLGFFSLILFSKELDVNGWANATGSGAANVYSHYDK